MRARLLTLAILLLPSAASALVMPAPVGIEVLIVADTPNADPNLAVALQQDGHNVTIRTGDFANNNQALRGDLSRYRLVVWVASGDNYGDQHSDAALFTALEQYVQGGGRVFVTGYDSIASPSDPLLIQFLGGTASRDVPAPPGAISGDTNSLTVGVVDVRGQTPAGFTSDRDALTGVQPGTVIVCPTSTDATQGQWTLRTLGAGEIAWVSNGNSSSSPQANWTTTAAGPTGVYNAALRNFAWAASNGPPMRPPPNEPPPEDPSPVPPPDEPPPDVDPLPPLPDTPAQPAGLQFNADDRAGLGWTIGLHATGSHSTAEERWFVGGAAEVGLTLQLDMDGADGRRYPALNGLVGDYAALMARGWFFGRVRGNTALPWMVAVGGQLHFQNAIHGGDVRVPSLVGLASPEIGAVIRDGVDPQLYVALHAPFSFLLESWLALELRASLFFFDGLRADGGNETLVQVSAGLSVR